MDNIIYYSLLCGQTYMLDKILTTSELEVAPQLYVDWKYTRQNFYAYVVPYLHEIMRKTGQDLLLAEDLFIIEFDDK